MEPSGLDKSGQRVSEMFRQIAPRYDLMNHVLSANMDRLWRRRAVQILPFDNPALAGLPWLDVCTGTGDLALAIRKKLGKLAKENDSHEPVEVIGTDFCNAMLDIAREKSRDQTLPVDFREADSQSLPFPDDRFAAVTVAFGLRNVADTDQGLREMTRVCAPGGRVLVLEFSRPRMPGLRQVYSFYFKRVLPRVGQFFARNDKSAYEYLPQSVSEFPDYEALAERMTATGLTHVQFRPLTIGVATIYWGDKPPQVNAGDTGANASGAIASGANNSGASSRP
ncbi:MAG: bifunctional demethylmenaquinone methyltransferase/2-methoxy-6-polyprenyl-1,4-benzoquinol methylase UbiE [Planctomycetota bacterium]